MCCQACMKWPQITNTLITLWHFQAVLLNGISVKISLFIPQLCWGTVIASFVASVWKSGSLRVTLCERYATFRDRQQCTLTSAKLCVLLISNQREAQSKLTLWCTVWESTSCSVVNCKRAMWWVSSFADYHRPVHTSEPTWKHYTINTKKCIVNVFRKVCEIKLEFHMIQCLVKKQCIESALYLKII